MKLILFIIRSNDTFEKSIEKKYLKKTMFYLDIIIYAVGLLIISKTKVIRFVLTFF